MQLALHTFLSLGLSLRIMLTELEAEGGLCRKQYYVAIHLSLGNGKLHSSAMTGKEKALCRSCIIYSSPSLVEINTGFLSASFALWRLIFYSNTQ